MILNSTPAIRASTPKMADRLETIILSDMLKATHCQTSENGGEDAFLPWLDQIRAEKMASRVDFGINLK